MQRWLGIVGCSLLAIQGSMRAAQNSGPIPTYRVNTDRVLVEFVAIDQKGQFITDLRPEEVELYVDGKKQPIERLINPRPTPSESPPPRSDGGAGGDVASRSSESNQPASAAPTVILLDKGVFDAATFSRTVTAVRRFIKDSQGANHSLMIAEIDRGLRIVAPPSVDTAVLLEALDALRPSGLTNPLDTSQLSHRGSPEFFGARQRYKAALERQLRSLESGLTRLCYILSAFPGRKHVVFFTEGYPVEDGLESIRNMIALANRFGIAFYTIDARGLAAPVGIGRADVTGNFAAGPGGGGRNYGASENGLSEVELANFHLTMLKDLRESQDSLIALAAATNGTAFYNTNDLGTVLRSSSLEREKGYLAVFDPDGGKTKTGGYHRLLVRTSRPHVLVRSQLGFREFSAKELASRRLEIAFRNPELFPFLPVLIQIQRQNGEPKLVLGVPADRVQFRPNGPRFEMEAIFVARILDGQGEPISEGYAVQKGFHLDLDADQRRGLSNQPLLTGRPLNLPSGKYRVVAVVEDRLAGTLGAASLEFVLP